VGADVRESANDPLEGGSDIREIGNTPTDDENLAIGVRHTASHEVNYIQMLIQWISN
jgi:hypothetical protein